MTNIPLYMCTTALFIHLSMDISVWGQFVIVICFILGCADSLFLLCRLSPVEASRGYSSLWCGAFCSRAQALSMQASVGATHGLNSYSVEAQLPLRIWNLPRPGTESMSPALIGRYLTTREAALFWCNFLKNCSRMCS